MIADLTCSCLDLNDCFFFLFTLCLIMLNALFRCRSFSVLLAFSFCRHSPRPSLLRPFASLSRSSLLSFGRLYRRSIDESETSSLRCSRSSSSRCSSFLRFVFADLAARTCFAMRMDRNLSKSSWSSIRVAHNSLAFSLA